MGAEEFVVVVAPDKFKGSLDAVEVGDVIAEVIARRTPHVRIIRSPIADGGEGTVELAIRAGFAPVTTEVDGPLGDLVAATYALRGTEAVVEMAAAAGLRLLPSGPTPATAWHASTSGVGQLVRHAIDAGARTVFVGAGGSASTDGGQGAAHALGLARDRSGADPDPDLSSLLDGVELVMACDVDNPLLGPHGAAAVYAPQKGADPPTVERLEARLHAWADEVAVVTGRDARAVPGAGAAGGFAFGMAALAGARIAPGIEVVMELTGLPEHLSQADLVIVGEGSLDHQSLHGKGPVGVADMSRPGLPWSPWWAETSLRDPTSWLPTCIRSTP